MKWKDTNIKMKRIAKKYEMKGNKNKNERIVKKY